MFCKTGFIPEARWEINELSDRKITTNPILQSLEWGGGQTGIALGEKAHDALVRYVGLLARWNRAYNLTSVRDPIGMVRHHILDCLVILPHVRGTRLLDVGTGAGLPGIVLAIARPDLECVLLDGNGKKTRFCKQVAMELGLSNVKVLQLRAEKYVPEIPFTTMTARAFGPLSVLRGHAARLLARDGRLLAMKGTMKEIVKELDDAPPKGPGGGRHSDFGGPRIVPLHVPNLAAERHLVIIEHALTT
uniref:Ribosomal RNA small subunit methyltransferase G n=1 Tax=Candidatus Kentrum sp. SD TaxID=2126332 RepID=A0A450Z6W9_9GAMM|nr:MAG: 16S rRNA m(7)G-527 methyltransferase [Candidatus Kentron sp. SD]VFK49560.1 MAG: 16S rRNA m(7)G-527 methyltransferase [Candidatus Kentron sp. SD]